MNYSRLKALLIDIDDTIVRVKPGANVPRSPHSTDWTGSLLGVLQLAGVELGGLSPEEADARIAKVQRDVQWWRHEDFIQELGLNDAQFWEFAHEREIEYLEPTGAEIRSSLERLRLAGLQLYITSNNPTTGIVHKLKLVGIEGPALFNHLIGASELRAMKWQPVFWEKALAHIGLSADRVAVVGDNPRDDFTVPREAGITHSFLIDRARDRTAENSDAITYVRDFGQIADCLLDSPSTLARPALG